MKDLNNVIIQGRLTHTPELRQTASGVSTCSFSVACNRITAKGDEEVDYITVNAYRKKAEFVSRYFTKGKPIIVRGQLRTRKYADKNDVMHYVTEVIADEIFFAGKAKNEESTEHNIRFTAPQNEIDDLDGFEEVISDSELPY